MLKKPPFSPQDSEFSSLVKDTAKLEHLRNAPETQQIFSILNQSVKGSLEESAHRAAAGDASELLSAIKSLLSTEEGTQLVEQMKKRLK